MRTNLGNWALLLLAAVAASAQVPEAASGTISGVVLNRASGTPVRQVLVTLSTVGDKPLDAVTYTDANGAFLFTYVPPGRYRLSANRRGYRPAWYGSNTTKRPPGILPLKPGEARHIPLRIEPLASISGRVFDPDGDPLPFATVWTLSESYDRRKPKIGVAGTSATNDRGEYRFFNISPGTYKLMASQRNRTALPMQAEAAAGQAVEEYVYGAQFYRNAGEFLSAATLVVAPGNDVSGIDFHLPLKPVVHLRGVVAVPEDVPAESYVQVTFYAQDVPDATTGTGGIFASPAPKRAFEAKLVAGSYLALATLSVPGRQYRGVERVDVRPGIGELRLQIERGIELSGKLEVQGEGAGKYRDFRVTLVPGDGLPLSSAMPEAAVKPDGTFRFPAVLPGIWDIGIRPIPPGGYIKAMLLGDEDVLTEDMVIGPDTRAPLNIVVSTRGAVVEGTVLDRAAPEAESKPAPGGVVLLAPAGKFQHVVSFYRVVPVDEAGHFEIKAITPGNYKLFAFEEMEPNEVQRPDFLKPFEDRGEPVEIAEGARVSVRLILIGAQAESAMKGAAR